MTSVVADFPVTAKVAQSSSRQLKGPNPCSSRSLPRITFSAAIPCIIAAAFLSVASAAAGTSMNSRFRLLQAGSLGASDSDTRIALSWGSVVAR